ncbi:MAG: ribonuclease P protein component [Candidatus Omnitrophica bacterium]|nr:ribonuclease P protein component [Candidatus Omnitrophota bacterium]
MKRFSLSRRERITSTQEFRLSLGKSAFYVGKSIKIGVSRNNLGISRIGVSMRRENFKLAVTRNKLRRYVKEAFRLNKKRISGGYDIIVMPRAQAAGLDYKGFCEDFICAAGKAGILSG